MESITTITNDCHPDQVAGFSPPFEIGEGVSTAERRSLSIHEKLSLAGRKGGIKTRDNHSETYYSEMGSQGGRPPLQSKSQLQAIEGANKEKENLPVPSDLLSLKVLLKRKIKAGEGCL